MIQTDEINQLFCDIDNVHVYVTVFVIQITHVIKEIQLFQQTPYRIEHHRRVIAVY